MGNLFNPVTICDYCSDENIYDNEYKRNIPNSCSEILYDCHSIPESVNLNIYDSNDSVSEYSDYFGSDNMEEIIIYENSKA